MHVCRLLYVFPLLSRKSYLDPTYGPWALIRINPYRGPSDPIRTLYFFQPKLRPQWEGGEINILERSYTNVCFRISIKNTQGPEEPVQDSLNTAHADDGIPARGNRRGGSSFQSNILQKRGKSSSPFAHMGADCCLDAKTLFLSSPPCRARW